MRIPLGAKNYEVTTETVYEAIPRAKQVRSYSTRSFTNLTTVFPSPTPNLTRYPQPISSQVTYFINPQKVAPLVRVVSRPTTLFPSA
jgi:hypothetical protein